mgnify:CR=1 FL=1
MLSASLASDCGPRFDRGFTKCDPGEILTLSRCYPNRSGCLHRPQFSPLLRAGGCIDRLQFDRSLTRTLFSITDIFLGKCAGSRRICRGVDTDAPGRTGFLRAGCPTSCTKTNSELREVDFTDHSYSPNGDSQLRSFGRRPFFTVAWGNAPGIECNHPGLAEGHIHPHPDGLPQERIDPCHNP